MIKYYNSLSWRLGTRLKTREPGVLGKDPTDTPYSTKSSWLKCLTLCLLFLTGALGFSQTITIGTGTATQSNLPIVSCYDYSYSQQIYTSAQLTQAGTIEKIRFYYNAGASIENWSNWTVYMAHTAKTTFTTTTDWVPLASLTQVFSGTINPVAGNWFDLILNTPFAYNGTSNLIVAVDENSSGYYCSASFRSFTSGANTGIYYRRDGTDVDPAAPPTATGRTASLAQMQVVFPSATVPNCAITHVPAASATGVPTNASLTWADGGAGPTSYDVYFGTATNPALVGNQTGTTYTPSILAPNTTYYWKVVPKNANGSATGCIERSFTTGTGLAYCTPSSSSASTYINNFSTTLGTTNISNLASGYTTTGYQSNFSGAAVTSYATGSFNFTMDVVGGTLGAAIWVDWNANGVFDAAERVFVTSGYGNGPYSGTIAVPLGTANGDYRLRAMVDYNASAPSDPCMTVSTRTETEDYKVTVSAPPACVSPSALTSSAITNDSATISWSASVSAPSGGYDYYYDTTNTAPTSGTTPSGNVGAGITTVNLSGLTSNTQYYYWVRANCAGSGTSTWSPGGSFTTACDSLTSFPWTENFESVTAPNLPNCWSQNDANADNDKWITYTTYGVGSSIAAGLYTDYNSGANNDYLILPRMTLTGNQRLKFFVSARSTSEPNDYRVVLSTTGNQPADFTNVIKPLTTVSSDVMTEIAPIDMSAYSGDVYIAVHVPSGGLDGYYLYVDNFTVEDNPSCITPSGLTVAFSSSTSADLSWVAPGIAPAVGYEWAFTTSITPPASGTATTGLTATIGSLLPATTYYLHVRSVCITGVDNSTWTTSAGFVPPVVTAVPWTEGFATTTLPAQWTNNSFTVGSSTGAGGNPGNTIYKNLYSYATTGNFSTPNLGTVAANQLFSFDYRLANYSSPYDAPASGSGNVIVEVSTNYGATYATLETITNDGVAGWRTKSYSMAAYAGQNVKFRITGNVILDEDYYLAFDNFAVTALCEGTPTGGTVNVTSQSVCSGFPVAPITVTGATIAAGITFQWEESIDAGSTWANATDGTGATTLTYQPPAFAGTTILYRLKVTCTNSSQVAYSTNSEINSNPRAVPFMENFDVIENLAGWSTIGFGVGTARGAIGNPGNNAYANIFTSTPKNIATASYGAIVAGQALVFDYQFSNYSSPFASPASGSGTLVVSVSTDCGATFTVLQTIANDGISGYKNKVISLGAYVGQNVLIDFTGNRTLGDWDLSIDNVGILVPAPIVNLLDPISVCEDSESLVTITGDFFNNVSSVKIGSTDTVFTVVDINTITFTVPIGATTGQVSVTTPGGTATSAGNLTVYPFPANGPITGPDDKVCSNGTLQLSPGGAGADWASSNEGVATVDGNGLVTGVSAGLATISFTITDFGCASVQTYDVEVFDAVVITSQPPFTSSIQTGTSGTISVTATGSGLAYQWYTYDADNDVYVALSNGADFSGVDSSTLSIIDAPETLDGSEYYCEVSGSAPCESVTSGSTIISVGSTAIVSSPQSESICTSGTAVFTVVTSGDVDTYVWYEDIGLGFTPLGDSESGLTFSGDGTPTLTVSGITFANNNTRYYVEVNGPANTVNSELAYIYVSTPPVVDTVSPTSAINCLAGGSTNFVATTSGSVDGYTYLYSTTGNPGTFAPIANGTPAGATYNTSVAGTLGVTTSPATPAGVYYYQVVANGTAPCAASNAVGFTVEVANPTISGQPANATALKGNSATFTVVSPTVGATYKWQRATTLAGTYSDVVNSTPAGVTYSGTTTATLTVSTSAATATGSGNFYRAVVAYPAACTVNSTGARLTVTDYCASVPTSNDGAGISNVTIGSTSFPIADVMYANNSGTPVNATQSTNVNFQVTFATGYTYDSHIWIDFNDDGDFIDAGELVKSGVSLGSNPTTLDLSFVMPLSAPVGVHRVRLGTADSGQATPNPCYSGTYGVTLDFAINVLAAPACAGTPTAGTATASVTDICVSGTTTLSVSGYTTGVTGISYQWYEGATAIVGATNPTYTSGTISANTTFYCKVTCANSGLSANTNTVAINVNSPSVDSTVAASRCGTGTVDLSATPSAGATISWYADATGGAPLATGASFTTPSISTTTNYYVDASIGGTSSNAGRVAPGASDTGSTFTDWGIVFDVLVPLKLESVDLYATTGGTVNIKIMNSALTTELFSTGNVTVVAGGTTTPNVIPLNFNMVPGTGYRILVKSYTGANLVRSSSANTFPYNSTNLNVTSSEWGGTTTGSYYYFYNLKSTTGCASPRTMVTATVTAPPALTLSASSATICSGNSTTVNVSSTVGDYDTYTWSPMTGVSGSAVAGYTFNPTATTSYTLTASNTASGCVNLASFAVNVDPLPAAIITPATSSVCANGSPVLLTASSTSSGAVVIGTGTNLNDQYAYPSPFSNWYGGAKHQMLYRASELTALGFVSGDIISGLAINVNSVASGFSGSLTGFSVAMGHTASNVLTSSSFIGSLTVVRTASTLTVPTSGFPANVNVPLTSTFIWNGTSNIVIQTSYSTNNGGSGAVITANSNPGFVSTNWYRADSQSVANVLSAGTPTGSSNDRPNIVLTKSSVFNYTWAPTTGLFTDAAMSIPYTGGVSATVYARPGETTAYVATATNPSTGCFAATTSANVIVVPATIWYADADGDGYGNDAITISTCDQPAGYVAIAGDCNDAVASINPGATEICYDGIDQNCNGSTTDGCPVITATLRAENCGELLTSLNQAVRGNSYSQSIPNGVTVTGYRFRITNLITNAVRIVDRSNYILQLTYTDFAEYNTPYSVEVALRLNQEWMEVYGAPCTITTPGVPNTVLTSTSCGATLVQMNNIIRAVVVPSALNYEYNVALIEGGLPVATTTLVRSGESFNLLQLTGIPIKFGAEYSVTIRVQVPTSSGPQWSAVAGAACSVFTPFAQEASIEGCGGENGITPANLNTVVYASPVGGATQYRFTLTDGLAYSQVYTTPSRFFKLSNFNALSPLTAGGTYSVTVEVEIYGNYYAGKDCNILVPGGVGRPITPITRTTVGTETLMGEFKAVAYPNPFANNFAINLRSNSTTPVSIAIYDMAGRLLEAREFKFDQLTTQQLGDRYPAGVYSVIVTQEQQTQTIRVVKQ